MRPPIRPPNDEHPETAGAASAADNAAAPADAAPPTDLFELDANPVATAPDNPFGLKPRELLFVAAYCGPAKCNASKAYELAGYKTSGSPSGNAARLMLRERIAAAIYARIGTRVGIMEGDEALEGISGIARADIRKVFPPNSWVAKLPDDVAACIKSIRPGKHGYTIELYPRDHALEVMAKVAGRLKDVVKHEFTLEDILARANRPEEGSAA
jgi:hypothetical protein